MDNPRREYYDNGQLASEVYFENGAPHRTDGPAIANWHENGQIEREVYIMGYEIHREDGPAYIRWDEDGNIIKQQFYLNDNHVSVYDVLDKKDAFAWVMVNE